MENDPRNNENAKNVLKTSPGRRKRENKLKKRRNKEKRIESVIQNLEKRVEHVFVSKLEEHQKNVSGNALGASAAY